MSALFNSSVASKGAAHHKPLAEMIRETVEAFVDAKMERADISEALYQISAAGGGPALIKRISQRLRKAVEAMLQTAQDIKSPPDKIRDRYHACSHRGRDVFLAGIWTISGHSPQVGRATRATLPVIHGGRDGEARL